MGAPLFTESEAAEWEARKKDAYRERAGDDILIRGDGSRYNKSIWPRSQAIAQSMAIARRNKMRARPDDILNVLLVGFHEKGSASMTPEEIWETGLGDRLLAANTPENRRHIYDVLEGLQQVPRSWAKSATTRFFRGTGKQGKPPWSEKPGAGLLSKDYGWTTGQSTWFIELFYSSHFFQGIFFADDSPDCYGMEGYEVEEGGGSRWAATRKERDTNIFRTLLDILEKQGLAKERVKPGIKKKKPRKPRTWKVGDRVTSRNLRDLPAEAIIHLESGNYPWGWRKTDKFKADITVREMVFISRERGKIQVRPVMEGHAFGEIGISSSYLYKEDWNIPESQATYQGQWEGETINIKVDTKEWGKTYKRVRYVVKSGPTEKAVKERPGT